LCNLANRFKLIEIVNSDGAMLSFTSNIAERVSDFCALIAGAFSAPAGVSLLPSKHAATRRNVKSHLAPVAHVKATPPSHNSGGTQWQRIAAVIEDGIAAGRATVALHAEALTKIDAAEFALSTIMNDLSAIMSLPPKRAVPARIVASRRSALAA
jgi:hypothetical protein